MKKFIICLMAIFCLLFLSCCTKMDEKNAVESANNIITPTTVETESSNEVLQFLTDKYDLRFTLWGPVGHDLYVFHVYPDHADWECHIMMPENTDDIEQYWNDLSWEIKGNEFIITNEVGGEWTETLTIDIATETAISARTGRVYQIYEIEPPLE